MQTILCNWYYERNDLTQPIIELAREVRIVFLNKFKPDPQDSSKYAGENISYVYWKEFTSPYDLLDYVKPDCVLFYDIEAFNQIALNIAAKNLKIKTIVLQHGLRDASEIDDAIDSSTGSEKIQLSSSSIWSAKYLFNSLRFANIIFIPQLIKFIYERKKFDLTVALFKNKFELRLADLYIEFSKQNASYHIKRDGITDSRIRYIGNPGYDSFFSRMDDLDLAIVSDYNLLIDAPFCEANFVSKQRMTTEQKNNYLFQLNEYCLAVNKKFYVKLHPLSYTADDLFKHSNISYFTDADWVELVLNSNTVFLAHFSTLAPPVMFSRPFFYFVNGFTREVEFVQDVIKTKFELSKISASDLFNAVPNLPLKEGEIIDYLCSTEGNARWKLKNTILEEVLGAEYKSLKLCDSPS